MHVGCCDSSIACEISFKVAAAVVSLGAITLLVLSILTYAGYFNMSQGAAYACSGTGAILVIPSTVIAFGDCFDRLETKVKVSAFVISLLVAITAIVLGSLTLHNHLAWGKSAGYLLAGGGCIVALANTIPMSVVLCPESWD